MKHFFNTPTHVAHDSNHAKTLPALAEAPTIGPHVAHDSDHAETVPALAEAPTIGPHVAHDSNHAKTVPAMHVAHDSNHAKQNPTVDDHVTPDGGVPEETRSGSLGCQIRGPGLSQSQAFQNIYTRRRPHKPRPLHPLKY